MLTACYIHLSTFSDDYFADESIEKACGCFRPCEETKYTVSVSAASLPSEYITPSLQTRYGRSKEYFM